MKEPKYKVNVPKEVGEYLKDHGTIHVDPAGATFITLPDVFTMFDGKVYRVATIVEEPEPEPALNLDLCSKCLGGSLSPSYRCSKCGGSGRSSIKHPIEYNLCLACNGTGYMKNGVGTLKGHHTCTHCNGTGKQPVWHSKLEDDKRKKFEQGFRSDEYKDMDFTAACKYQGGSITKTEAIMESVKRGWNKG